MFLKASPTMLQVFSRPNVKTNIVTSLERHLISIHTVWTSWVNSSHKVNSIYKVFEMADLMKTFNLVLYLVENVMKVCFKSALCFCSYEFTLAYLDLILYFLYFFIPFEGSKCTLIWWLHGNFNLPRIFQDTPLNCLLDHRS